MITIFLVVGTIVAVAVMIHYEILFQMTNLMPRLKVRHRFRIVLGVFGALVAHIIEIWLFAAVYDLMHHAEGWGQLDGAFSGSFMDCVYFSFTTFTTLGFGDIAPLGDIRYLTGTESLTGLVLITWSASFLYVEMRKFWDA
ncbi:potassium channel family protein [Porticoccaceae bacterium]|nr:potassium channel family protein [Porticoccaceae bacterium]